MNIDVTAAMTWVVGFAWAFIVIQWLDILRQALAIRPDVIPSDLNLGDRASVRKHIDILTGSSLIVRRTRSLLSGWSQGWIPSEVVDLATTQSERDANQYRVASFFVLLVLAACVAKSDQADLAWIGIAALGATIFAKGMVYARIDAFIEQRLLARLPANLPGTAMTAVELAAQLGAAINDAFKNNVPQPEKMAAAVTGAVENFRKAAAETLETVQKKIAESQSALLSKWTDQEKQAIASLETSRKALEALNTSFATSQAAGAEKLQAALTQHVQQFEKASSIDKLQSALTQHVQQLEKATSVDKLQSALTHHVQQFEKATGVDKMQSALTQHVQQLEKATTTANEKAGSSLNAHADSLNKASQAIASQLDKIMALEKEIQKVLHIQQLVDGTLKTVTTTDEFKQTLASLRTHIEASDKLLAELSKPRTIRLVESDASSPKPAAPAAPAPAKPAAAAPKR